MKIQETRIKIQEASKDLQMGGIVFLKVPKQVIWRQRPKNDEKSEIGPGRETEYA